MPSYPTGSVLMQKSFLDKTYLPVLDFVPINDHPVYDNRIFSFFPMQTATAVIMCSPILVLYIVFNKKLTGNLTEGGIKE